MHDICHFDRISFGLEMMLVMPEGVWPESLLIDKITMGLAMGDLRGPTQWDVQQWADLVIDDQTRIHRYSFEIGKYLKRQIGRCQFIEVFW